MNDRRAASEGDPDLLRGSREGVLGGVLVGVDMQTTLALHCGGVLLDVRGRQSVMGSCWPGTAACPLAQSQSGKPSVEVLAPGPPAVCELIAQLVVLVDRLMLRVVGKSARAQVTRVGDLEDDCSVRLGPDIVDRLEAEPPRSHVSAGLDTNSRLLKCGAAQVEPCRRRQPAEAQRQARQTEYGNAQPASQGSIRHADMCVAGGDNKPPGPGDPDGYTEPKRPEDRDDVPDRKAGSVETY
jgi:hypothetical protein